MDKWTPSEQYLKEVLCRARETDWEWSDYRANDALAKMADGTVRYRAGAPYGENGEHLEYNEYLWKRQNYPAIPETYMQPGKGWRGMSLSDILTNIFKGREPEADHYRNILFEAIDSYRLAAKFMLIDTYRRIGDRYRYRSNEYVAMQDRRETIRKADSSGYEYMPESPVELYGIFPFLGARECDNFDECRGEIDCSTDEDLVKKIIAVERIKLLISERMRQSESAGQTGNLKGDIPGGFEGFCVAKINEMPETVRDAFLNTNSGDQSYYEYGQEWMAEYNLTAKKKISSYQAPVSRAKKRCKSLLEN